MEGMLEMQSVTNEIKSEMEVSAINEILDARKIMFATIAASKRNCIRSSNFRGIYLQASEVKSVNYVANKMKSAMEMATE